VAAAAKDDGFFVRAALWRQWKTPRRRRAALVAKGVSEWAARNTACSGRDPWYLARSRPLSTGLSNAYFRSLGLHPCSARVSARATGHTVSSVCPIAFHTLSVHESEALIKEFVDVWVR
jgi:hypothetical protein